MVEAFAHQVPAGSLPYDDDDLARLADFGIDLRAWKGQGDRLHGFIAVTADSTTGRRPTRQSGL